MNHCIDVVCCECGYAYCALGCRPPVEGNLLNVKLLNVALEQGLEQHHYKHLVCPNCGGKKVVEHDTALMSSLKKTN